MPILVVIVAVLALLIYQSKKSATTTIGGAVSGGAGATDEATAKMAAESPTLGVSAISIQKAQDAVTSGAKLSDAYAAIAKALPSTSYAIEQASHQIQAGTAGVGDIVVFNADLQAYNSYVSKGGTMTYEQFTNAAAYPDSAAKAGISAEDMATINTAKQTTVQMDAAEAIANYKGNIQWYYDQLSEGSALKEAIATALPAVQDGISPAEQTAINAIANAANYGIPASQAAEFANMNTGQKIAYMEENHYGGY